MTNKFRVDNYVQTRIFRSRKVMVENDCESAHKICGVGRCFSRIGEAGVGKEDEVIALDGYDSYD